MLTENSYWTFSSSDWSLSINIRWDGKTQWSDVKQAVRAKMGKVKGEEVYFERQVQLREPDMTFA